MENEINIIPVLWTYYKRKEGETPGYPVKICVTYRRKRKYFPVLYHGKNLYLTQKDYDHINTTAEKDLRGNNRTVWNAIKNKQADVRKKIENIKPFRIEHLSDLNTGFLSNFLEYTDRIKASGKLGSYRAYNSAYRAFYSFRGGRELDPKDITVTMLKDFDAYLTKPHKYEKEQTERKVNKTSVAIYMRSLRVVYNECISKNTELAHYYPFRKHRSDKGKYIIRKGSGHKGIALKPQQIAAFNATPISADLSDPMYVAKQTWMFLFLCQGMNLKDFCELQYSNVMDDRIEYIRAKTESTEVEEKPIIVPLTKEIKAIIDEMGRPQKSGYVFDVLHKTMSPETKDKSIQTFTKMTNRWLKKICEQYKLPVITSYAARHSYASLMKWSGAADSLISEALGHQSVETTKIYLQRFDIDTQREANETALSILKAS